MSPSGRERRPIFSTPTPWGESLLRKYFFDPLSIQIDLESEAIASAESLPIPQIARILPVSRLMTNIASVMRLKFLTRRYRFSPCMAMPFKLPLMGGICILAVSSSNMVLRQLSPQSFHSSPGSADFVLSGPGIFFLPFTRCGEYFDFAGLGFGSAWSGKTITIQIRIAYRYRVIYVLDARLWIIGDTYND